MYKKIVGFVLLIMMLSFCVTNADAQSRSAQRKIDKVEKKKAEKKKIEERTFKKFQKRQLKIQTKETRKRMKKNRRTKSSPYGRNNKSTWWYRLWH